MILKTKKWLDTLCVILSCFLLFTTTSYAEGISLSGSRVIYPLNEKQISFSVHNTNDDTTYLIQSWVETEDEKKTTDFVVTPPIYQSAPNSENILRIIASATVYPQDRETLYYFKVKAIPGLTNSDDQSRIVIATETQLKFFARPAGLSPKREKALTLLHFTQQGSTIVAHNPTPYYFTLTNLKLKDSMANEVMLAPLGQTSIPLTGRKGDTISYSSINDYGGMDKASSEIK
ncbi:TPA: fimbrial biogenesis chaperone [Providencia alcalifaciens]|uniref:fimbrial biogenesis chaperone n=1 Tax=Providencia sp. JUb39 TaxID=2724165 RepID=UPI00164ECFBC|nr:molecular chaperone [Providencia sp. JUb39]MBC5792348.1 molecular chaperone [Providencia sp. JUb39]